MTKTVTSEEAPTEAYGGRETESMIITVRSDKARHERLRKLAFDKQLAVHDFIVQGIEQVLKAKSIDG